MEIATHTLELIGLLAILASLSIIFTQLMNVLLGRVYNPVRSSALIVISFLVAYFAVTPAMGFVGLGEHAPTFETGLSVLFWISVAYLLDTSVRKFVWRGLMAEHGTSHVPKLVRDLVTLLIYATAIMMIMHLVYDEPIGAVLATSGGLAFVIGLAAQKTLSEAFAGLSLSLSKTLRVGDYLEVNGVYGRVDEMNWRSVSLHNPHTDSHYIFPNSVMASSTVLNYCLPTERFKNWVKFTVEVHAPPELVMKAVMHELRNSRYVFQNPKPDINCLEFNEHGILYRIRYCFDGDDPWWDAQNEVVSAIWAAMRRHGFRFAVVRQHMNSANEWDTAPEPTYLRPSDEQMVDKLRKVSLLSALSETQLSQLVEQSDLVEWTAPQCLFDQNEAADSLYLLIDGEVDLHLLEDSASHAVATCRAGELIGLPLSGAHTSSAQPQSYCRTLEIPIAALDALGVSLDAAAQGQVGLLRESYREAVDKAAEKSHAQSHLRLRRALKAGLTHYYRGGLIGKILSSVIPAGNEQKLAESIADSCALVVGAGSRSADAAARNHFDELVSHLSEIHHVSHTQIIRLYDEALAKALQDPQQARKRVVDEVSHCRKVPDAAHLLMASCQVMAGVSAKPNEQQHAILTQLAEALGSHDQHDEMIERLSQQSEPK